MKPALPCGICTYYAACCITNTIAARGSINLFAIKFMHRLSPILLLILSSCSRYTKVVDSSSKLYTDVATARIRYFASDYGGLYLDLIDSKKNLAGVRPIGTAYVWNDSKVYKLMAKDYGGAYPPGEHAVSWKLCFLDSGTLNGEFPLPADTYNISVQFNGYEGVNTLCGSFKLVRETHMISDADLH